MKTGYTLLTDPFLNKGTAFSEAEREEYGLVGLLPPTVQTLDEQIAQAYGNYQARETVIDKRHYLMNLFSRNRTLFFALFAQHVAEFMPVVYDPGIADSIRHYSEYFVTPQHAAYLSIDHPERIEETLTNAADGRDIDIIVVTDAGAILGIGDWGTNGVAIATGKLMVYTAAAGIDPRRVLPVVIDAGTTRQSLLDDPLYLGVKHERVNGEAYDDFVDKFVTTAEHLFPNLYLHFEDFGRDNAARILHRYEHTYATFNDDIEGTGIIVLAGLLGAMNITHEKLTDQRYMCFGAGTAGCGIVERIFTEMTEQGLSADEARKHFTLVDKQGVLFDDMPDLTPEQRKFALHRADLEAQGIDTAQLTTLEAAVDALKPTILVGTSTVPGAFTESIVKKMASYTDRPIIFPLSNPTELAEATASDLIHWTDGRALVATGIPAAPVEYDGVTYEIGQANNALIYPGLGLGVITSRAKLLTDAMISAAAHSLGGIVGPSQPGAAVIPPVSRLADFSNTVAEAVAREAVQEQLNHVPLKESEIADAVIQRRWMPVYEPLTK